jgi:hypothetical protein
MRGAWARGVAARWRPARHRFARPAFEIEFLQKFE